MTLGDAPIKLSVVVASRNDDHGGNLLRRMQLFLDGLADDAGKFEPVLELIVVEWNPPPDRACLREALRWPADTYLRTRIVQVPNSVHKRYLHADQLPIFQMIAKNVGIRRARGDFVLATNIDILLSHELSSYLASEPLAPEEFYRVDRYDVPEIPEGVSADERLAYCKAHVLRIHRKEGTYVFHRTGADDIWGLGTLIPWKFHRWALNRVPRRVRQRVPLRVRRWWGRQVRWNPAGIRLHTNACGDFTLMAREAWGSLRGYPEFEMFSIHIDTLLCYSAHFLGLQERFLEEPLRIYHIEHPQGWASDSGAAPRGPRAAGGVPQISDRELDQMLEKMHATRHPLIVNGEHWGLADESLPEDQVS